MEKYYHEPDTASFQYQVAAITKEMKFRLVELIDSCRKSIAEIPREGQAGTASSDDKDSIVRYRFSSLVALLQTFRDALPRAIGKDVNIKEKIGDVPHATLLRQLRNSLVHEGYQPFGLWVDGQYYMGTNYIANDQRGRAIQVDAPEVDVETLALEYSAVYCVRLAKLLEELPKDKKLKGPPRSYEWFEATFAHPAVKKFSGFSMPSRSEVPPHPEGEPAALDVAIKYLREIAAMCNARLEELRALPSIPFP